MLAGCRRVAETAGDAGDAGDAGERSRGSASASAVLPSAGGAGCEIAEPLVDSSGSFAGARFRRRRPRIIMWCPRRSRTTYSPPGRGRSSISLQVSRGTWSHPLAQPTPTVTPQPDSIGSTHRCHATGGHVFLYMFHVQHGGSPRPAVSAVTPSLTPLAPRLPPIAARPPEAPLQASKSMPETRNKVVSRGTSRASPKQFGSSWGPAPPLFSAWHSASWPLRLSTQNKGRFVGMPGRRGYCAATGATLSMIRYPNRPTRTTRARVSPNRSIPAGGQRSSSVAASGGSETTSRPPRDRKAEPHSAVTAGRPNDRPVTHSKASLRSAWCPSDSALPVATSANWPASRRVRQRRRNAARRWLDSSRTVCVVGQQPARISPGGPPPEPRSNTEPGARPSSDSITATNPRA